MNASLTNLLARTCNCVKTPTTSIIIFELLIFTGTIAALVILSKFQSNIIKKYLIVASGVFVFELFTAPMWVNSHLGEWAYVYKDVSWVLTVGWTTLIISTVTLVDHFFAKLKEWERFPLYLIILLIAVIFLESLVIKLGIRTYAPETLELIHGLWIPILNVPLQILYYVPVFISLVIGFYKYWVLVLENRAVVPVKSTKWLRNLSLSFLAVIFFELMIDPMVVNAKLPAWSYFYRDNSILLSGIWVLIIWLATTIVDKLLIHLDLSKRFLFYLLLTSVIMLPIEAWLINNGYRIYGPTAVSNFSGFKVVGLNVPIEVAFAIPMYMALVISLIRYWQITLDNKQ